LSETAVPSRIAALDLVRGVAVLGILAVNVFNFAGPGGSTYSPNLPAPGSEADNYLFGAVLLLFEGKMRALFTLLFGASLLLFVERADQRGSGAAGLQRRRLGWLALLGYLHFALLWDGDILFLYAVVGFAALALRRAPPLPLVLSALVLFTFWQGAGAAFLSPQVSAEAAVRAGTASKAEVALHAAQVAALREDDRDDLAEAQLSFADQIGARLSERPWMPLMLTVFVFGESFPLMLIGMALYRSGFFSGAWSRRRLWWLAGVGIGVGGGPTLGFVWWAQGQGYPEFAMQLAIHFLLSFPHLLMALGYAALLMLAAPRLLAGALGRRLEAAGRMAFTNYIGTSLVMGAVFGGWGLGLFGQIGATQAWLLVPLVWAGMLLWSKPWLACFRQGPLEWLWRSLTERRLLASCYCELFAVNSESPCTSASATPSGKANCAPPRAQCLAMPMPSTLRWASIRNAAAALIKPRIS
jgi:uncharacterized protein